jgi:hypothetical protein
MSCLFQNIDTPPPPPSRPASVYPPPLLRGEDTLAGWKGGWPRVGGQYFGRRKTQLCTLPISNPLCSVLTNISYYVEMHSDLSELVTKCRHYLSQLPDLLRDGWSQGIFNNIDTKAFVRILEKNGTANNFSGILFGFREDPPSSAVFLGW